MELGPLFLLTNEKDMLKWKYRKRRAMAKKKENLKKAKEKLKKCKKEKDEYLAGWQRSRADFINYKKEERERIEKILKHANENLILKILPALDNFEKAIQEAKNAKGGLIEGFLQIENQLKEILRKEGVERIKAIGKEFNPEVHEAVEEVETDEESGIIVEEIQPGYKYKGKVIRPSKVKVAK